MTKKTKYVKLSVVKPILSGPPTKRTPSIKQTLNWVPKLISHISLYNKPLFSGHLYIKRTRTLK